MASRWRIRHKLMSGLGLVVLLNAVLLSGTLRGLWSYYLTTNSIRFKLHELFAAEQLKAAVVDLIAPENTARMIRKPELVPDEVAKARSALDAYAAAGRGDPRQQPRLAAGPLRERVRRRAGARARRVRGGGQEEHQRAARRRHAQ